MKKTSPAIAAGNAMANHKHYPMTNDEDMQCDSVWVEFEASFIQVLSGTESSKKITAVFVQPVSQTRTRLVEKRQGCAHAII